MATPAVVEGYLEYIFLPVFLSQIGRDDIQPTIRDAGGQTNFWPIAKRYNAAAAHLDVLGLADVEQGDCAPEVLAQNLPNKRPRFHLRLAVRMLESWLLADRRRIATFLRVPIASIPVAPDDLEHPKIELINIARRSTSRNIREALLPGDSGGIVGPDYVATMVEFIQQHWQASDARLVSPSLDRACWRWQTV